MFREQNGREQRSALTDGESAEQRDGGRAGRLVARGQPVPEQRERKCHAAARQQSAHVDQ